MKPTPLAPRSAPRLLPFGAAALAAFSLALLGCGQQSGEAESDASVDEAETETAEAPEAADEGWISLFDGETLNGWRPSTLGSATFEAVDGTIRGVTVEGSPNTFLISEAEFGDFEFEFEVKVHDELNSGVQIRSREKSEADLAFSGRDGQPATDLNRFFGPQVEVMSSPGKSGYIYGEATGRGWISPEPQDREHTHEHVVNGEWNHYRVVAKGSNIQTWINGTQVADLTDEPLYETHPRGHIGLQVHGIRRETGPFDVAWRNLRIRELD